MRRAVLLTVLVAAPALAQDRQATEQRLNSLREQISGVERQVRQTRGQETSELRALEGLDAEVQLRAQLVEEYRGQIGERREETETLRASIERLEDDIEEAKRSYRRRARHAYMHGRRNALALIFGAGSVNQMLVRARYLQQFASRRRGQVERIAQKTSELRTREVAVRTSLEETQRLLQQREAERAQIAERRRERSALIADLRTQRGRLERELEQRRTDAAQLAGLVQDLLAQERARAEADRQRREREAARAAAEAEAARIAEVERRARDAARRAAEADQIRRRPEQRTPDATPDAPPAAETPPATPAEPAPSPPVAEARPAPPPEPAAERPAPPPAVARDRPTPRTRPAAPPPAADRPVNLTGSFAANRGRLPRPADGTITGRFGTRTDPVTNTQTSSPGVDISTAPGAPARSVFEGVVQRVGTIPTYGTYVMISHGEYVTLYGNLSAVSVQPGTEVRAGQTIGRAGTAQQRRGSSLFFALYQGGQPVDPASWLR